MVNVNGAVNLEGGPLAARIGELHLLLTVMGVPGTRRQPGGAGRSATPLGQSRCRSTSSGRWSTARISASAASSSTRTCWPPSRPAAG